MGRVCERGGAGETVNDGVTPEPALRAGSSLSAAGRGAGTARATERIGATAGSRT
jgi:hypothetical protein